jgi:hypothetical protein
MPGPHLGTLAMNWTVICFRYTSIHLREQVMYPRGSLGKMPKFTCKLLGFVDRESLTINMPGAIQQFSNLSNIMGWYCHREPVGIDD